MPFTSVLALAGVVLVIGGFGLTLFIVERLEAKAKADRRHHESADHGHDLASTPLADDARPSRRAA